MEPISKMSEAEHIKESLDLQAKTNSCRSVRVPYRSAPLERSERGRAESSDEDGIYKMTIAKKMRKPREVWRNPSLAHEMIYALVECQAATLGHNVLKLSRLNCLSALSSPTSSYLPIHTT
jgi:hypothetical protein